MTVAQVMRVLLQLLVCCWSKVVGILQSICKNLVRTSEQGLSLCSCICHCWQYSTALHCCVLLPTVWTCCCGSVRRFWSLCLTSIKGQCKAATWCWLVSRTWICPRIATGLPSLHASCHAVSKTGAESGPEAQKQLHTTASFTLASDFWQSGFSLKTWGFDTSFGHR